MPRLVMVCGLPGSGRTTTALRVARELPAIRLNAQEWLHNLSLPAQVDTTERVESLQWQMAQSLLRIGTSVVLEFGSDTQHERESRRRRAVELGATVELRHLAVDPAVLVARLSGRPDAAAQLVRLAESRTRFETPTNAELLTYSNPVTLS